MIGRVWHGWTTPERADDYEQLLRTEVFVGILGKQVPGFHRIELCRRPAGEEVEFMTVMWFDSLDDIRGFAGEDAEAAYVPRAARQILKRFDPRSQHYEVREVRQASS